MSGRKYGHLMLHLIYYTGRLTAAAWLVGFIFFGMNFKARMENVIILTMVYSTSLQALQYSELYDRILEVKYVLDNFCPRIDTLPKGTASMFRNRE